MAKGKEVVVDLAEKITIVGTGKYGLTKDKEFSVHPLKAKVLIAKGAAKAK